jgi:short-subunit dehydrogenase
MRFLLSKRWSSSSSLSGPVDVPGRAVVIGATGGIGRAFVEQLAAKGHELLLVARNRDRLEELAKHLRATYRVAVEVLAADLADETSLRSVEDRIRQDASLEVLVNSAGIASWGRFFELDLERETDVIRINVIAGVRLTRAALATMLPRRRGGIVNVASLYGYTPIPFCANYGATKAYLISFTEALYEELRGTGVRIQVVCPGFTRTDLLSRAGVDVTKLPSFIWGQPEMIARNSLAALRRGRSVCIPGIRFRMHRLLLRLMPRSAVRRWTARGSGNFKGYRLENHASSGGGQRDATTIK